MQVKASMNSKNNFSYPSFHVMHVKIPENPLKTLRSAICRQSSKPRVTEGASIEV